MVEKRDVMPYTLVDHYECTFETHEMLYHTMWYHVSEDSNLQSWLWEPQISLTENCLLVFHQNKILILKRLCLLFCFWCRNKNIWRCWYLQFHWHKFCMHPTVVNGQQIWLCAKSALPTIQQKAQTVLWYAKSESIGQVQCQFRCIMWEEHWQMVQAI
jgi:hypothetical protein